MNHKLRFVKLNLLIPATVSILLLFNSAYALDNESEGKKPAHHTENGFRNPYIESKKRGFFKYMKMRFFSDEEFADYESSAHKIPWMETDIELINNPADNLQITWIGHATVLIQYRGVSILTDPMFSDRASPLSFLGPERHNQA